MNLESLNLYGSLFVVHSSLVTMQWSPVTIHRSLFTRHCSLVTGHYSWFVVRVLADFGELALIFEFLNPESLNLCGSLFVIGDW